LDIVVLNGLQVYDYHGKLLSTPQCTWITGSALSMPMISLSNDFLAVLEPTKHASVHFFHTSSGQLTTCPLQVRKEEDTRKLVHDGNLAVMNIVSVSLSQSGGEVRSLQSIEWSWSSLPCHQYAKYFLATIATQTFVYRLKIYS
jgi:hypothetical protein